jgi:HECT-domain (ubiquitin-transferase)
VDEVQEFVKAAFSALLKESELQISWMAQKFRSVVGLTVLDYFTPLSIRARLEVSSDMTIVEMKKFISFQGHNEEFMQMFWKVMEELSLEERKSFVKFATGHPWLESNAFKISSYSSPIIPHLLYHKTEPQS